MTWLTILLIALGVVLLVVLAVLPLATWVFYLAVMHVDKMVAQGVATPEAHKLARTYIYPVALLCNAALAWTWAPVAFLARPREFATTKFLNRMVERGGWRAERALLIRHHLLNHYDRRGVHT